jgi:hypothetical protein
VQAGQEQRLVLAEEEDHGDREREVEAANDTGEARPVEPGTTVLVVLEQERAIAVSPRPSITM